MADAGVRVLVELDPWRLIATIDELVAALVARRQELGLSQAETEHRCGFHQSYLSHLEQPSKAHGRNLGQMSLPVLLDVLGVRLALVAIDRPRTLRAA